MAHTVQYFIAKPNGRYIAVPYSIAKRTSTHSALLPYSAGRINGTHSAVPYFVAERSGTHSGVFEYRATFNGTQCSEYLSTTKNYVLLRNLLLLECVIES